MARSTHDSAKWRVANDQFQMNTSVPRRLVDRFDAACKRAGRTRRETILDMMDSFATTVEKSKNGPMFKVPVFGIGVVVTLSKDAA